METYSFNRRVGILTTLLGRSEHLFPQGSVMLARLLRQPGEFVTTADLIAEMYGANPPASAGSCVRSAAYELRRALRSAGVELHGVRTHGYRVILPSLSVAA